jgi:hypothetical protein
MASTIITKNKASGAPSSLSAGELAINTTEGSLYYGSTNADTGTSVSSSFKFGMVTASVVSASGNVEGGSLRADDLTAGRVAFIGTDGLLVDDSDLTFTTATLTATNISLNGNITSPASKIGFRDLDWAGNIDGGNETYAQGDVIYHATATSTTRGDIYAMNTSGVVVPADADDVDTASTILVVALGTNASLGLLLRGTVVLRISPGAEPGRPIYLSTTAGQAQAAAPSETGDVVRVLGYQLTPNGDGDNVNVCYFNPDNTWVELT